MHSLFNNTTVWFTGLPCSGKTTLSLELQKFLRNIGFKSLHLDGDICRKGLCSDLGFSLIDREENIRRVSWVAEMANTNHIPVLASYISPSEKIRLLSKNIITNLSIVYVKCSVEKCIQRDVKGMWKKAMSGEIPDFTGYNAPFEEPSNPDIVLNTDTETVDESLSIIKKFFDLGIQ
jgi:adenylylsulfate kinase